MNHILRITGGLLALLVTVACNHDEVFPDQAFIKMYGGGYEQEGTGVALLPGGGYLLAGSTQSFSAGQYWDLFLVTTDKFGDATRTDHVSTGRNYRAKGLVPLNNGSNGYVVLGEGENTTGLSKIHFLRLNAQGEPSGAPVVYRSDRQGYDLAGRVLPLPDGGFVIVGTTSEVSTLGGSVALTDPTDILLLRLDANGNQVWERTFGKSRLDLGADVQVLANGNILVLGTVLREPEKDQDMILIEVNSEGIIRNSLTFGEARRSEQAIRLLKSAGGWTIFANQGVVGSPTPLLVTLDANFQQLTYIKLDQQGGLNPADILQRPDGYAILGATPGSSTDNTLDWWLLRTDFSGSPVGTATTFGGSKNDQPGALVSAPQGGFLLGGTFTFDNNTLAGLVLTDENGEVNGER